VGNEPVTIGHSLHQSPLFTSDALAELIESYPREYYGIFSMGAQNGDRWYWRQGDLDGTSGKEVLGFGNAIVEALACGTAVVATDCPYGPREILADGRYGLLVPIGDSDALARAIGQAMATPPDRAALRARAATHTVTRAADALLGIIDGVQGRGASVAPARLMEQADRRC